MGGQDPEPSTGVVSLRNVKLKIDDRESLEMTIVAKMPLKPRAEHRDLIYTDLVNHMLKQLAIANPESLDDLESTFEERFLSKAPTGETDADKIKRVELLDRLRTLGKSSGKAIAVSIIKDPNAKSETTDEKKELPIDAVLIRSRGSKFEKLRMSTSKEFKWSNLVELTMVLRMPINATSAER
ncbi:hypothetical protein OROHE_014327 [Orobanche hederae]